MSWYYVDVEVTSAIREQRVVRLRQSSHTGSKVLRRKLIQVGQSQSPERTKSRFQL
jgi:hypothetical protein